MRTIKTIAILITSLLYSNLALAQESRPLSPRGKDSTQVGGEWVVKDDRTRYVGGKWLDVEYGRPIKRDRENIFGSGESYGEKLNGDALDAFEREHVTAHFYQHPDHFRIENVTSPIGDQSAINLSIDTVEDLHRLETLYINSP